MHEDTNNVIYEFGPFLLEPHARRLSRHGEPVPLAAAEFELLLLLVRNHGQVVEKKEIMSAVWADVEVEENNLTVRMSSLRRALGETKGQHQYIQTVTGRGYCFIVPVKELQAQTETNTPNAFPKTSVSPQPKSRIRGFRLYALLLLALIATSSLVYAVFRWRKGGESQAALQSMKMSRVTQSGRVYHATLSPDGQDVAYVERAGDIYSLWLQRAGTTSPLQLLAPAKVSYLNPVFSRDGNTLYYSKCQPECELHRIPVLGGVETSLGIRATSPITFSPDGKHMAYIRSDAVETGVLISLIVADADGTNPRTINSRSDGMAYQGGTPAWSPDGKTIALPLLVSEEGRQRPMKIFGFSAADGAESTLSSKSWRFVKDVAWLPDGSGLIINAREEASAPDLAVQIWHVPLTGGEPRRITNDLNTYWSLDLSADGHTVMALQMQQSSSLWVAPVENPSAAVQVTRGTIDRLDGANGLSLAADGRLIYVTRLGSKRDLWSIKTDGSGLKQLTDEPHKDMSPVVTPDGRYIVFASTRDGAPRIWRADADGRNPTRLTHGSYDTGPLCSPDGQWVIYSTFVDGKVPQLRKVPIAGGDPTVLTDEYALYPAISPDGKTIAYYYMDMKGAERRRLIKLIAAEDGARIKTLPAPKNFGLVLRWHPKGDALSYRDGQATGIWRLPLDGTPTSQLIHLSGDHLYDFCYSPDGRQLAYASGPDLSDVILITNFK